MGSRSPLEQVNKYFHIVFLDGKFMCLVVQGKNLQRGRLAPVSFA